MYVKNRCRPEASIAEGYLEEECLIFCSRYLNASVKKKSKWYNKSQEKTDVIDEESPLFPKVGYPLGRKKKGKKKEKSYTLDSNTLAVAHRYVLFNCQDGQVESYIKEKVVLDNVSDHIKWLAIGPSSIARKYTGYFCNGYKFYTRAHDEKCKTQNSGVSLTALTPSFASTKDHNPVMGYVTYYGIIKSIIEIDYWSSFSVVLFKCDWFHVEVDDYGLTRVNFKKLCSKDDPFVLASQVHQVFYVQDGLEEDWHYVNRNLPRGFFYAEGQYEETYVTEVHGPEEDVIPAIDHDEHHNLHREGAYERVEVPVNTEMNDVGHEDSSDIDDTDWDWMEPSK
uniref:DUF4216 domain-containing protein n=1 Tax=Chenopodium quinoa TaxID=63459 RepID=A0A803L1P0_CHEQI